jgi:hypothetical protein
MPGQLPGWGAGTATRGAVSPPHGSSCFPGQPWLKPRDPEDDNNTPPTTTSTTTITTTHTTSPRWCFKGKGLDEVARRALLALVGAPQILLDSCVGGAGVDEGQARVNRFVVVAPCPRHHPQPDAVLVVKASLRLGPGSRLGGEEVHNTVDLIVVLAESTDDNGRGPSQVLQTRRRASWRPSPALRTCFPSTYRRWRRSGCRSC